MKNKRWPPILITILILSLLCGALVFFSVNDGHFIPQLVTQYKFQVHQKEQLANLVKAKDNWKNKDIENYHLHIEVTTQILFYNAMDGPISPTCFIDIDVQNKDTILILKNTCDATGYLLPKEKTWTGGEDFNLFAHGKTVNGFFTSIEKNLSKPLSSCPNGCDCDGYYVYSIDYDATLGYPNSVQVSYHKPEKHAPAIFCNMLGVPGIVFPNYNVSVTPMP